MHYSNVYLFYDARLIIPILYSTAYIVALISENIVDVLSNSQTNPNGNALEIHTQSPDGVKRLLAIC